MMISLMFPPSQFHVPAIIFYSCVWLPLLRLKQTLLDTLRLVFRTVPPMECSHVACIRVTGDDQFYDLPVVAFHEVEGMDAKVDRLCSVCLGDFQGEEEVSRLPGCGHVFHAGCIRSWLERDRFTCPLCRALIFEHHACCGRSGLLTIH
ncbi:RING-H2 finger protein ATL18-like [Magnolia sinica]|uniref:RING-H2 finger protein ATL18-like n=1 Tax=Magnolia sinica TaxID=86752 RepID=UPI002657CF01|nr:RING-H2 finger protein ATL18-like [Magnolia sinica]